MINVVLSGVIAFLVGAAAGYIYIRKKKGDRCIGCPYAGQCGGNCK